MKTLFVIVATLMSIMLVAQTPQAIRYQAVVRNSTGNIVPGQNVVLQITILQGSPAGTSVYSEQHLLTTDNFGLIALSIGEGSPVSGTFALIDWSNGDYFLKTEFSDNGGSTFVFLGTSQLLSVPFALYANKTEYYDETDPAFTISPASGIVLSDINNWDEAYGWGNHNTAGYLTSFSETDPSWSGSNTENGSIFRSGPVGIGTSSPLALFHTKGLGTGDGNLLFEGAYKSSNPGAAPVLGAGTRMMWYPDKAAFRVGGINGSQWDTDSVGIYSAAFGYNTTSKGSYSFSMGFGSKAGGITSMASGIFCFATGDYSMAAGYYTTASHTASVALGYENTSSGNYAFSMGYMNTASGENSVAIGRDNNATGNNSVALGYSNDAVGNYSASFGYGNNSSALLSMTWGSNCFGIGVSSTAWGSLATASGSFSTACGISANAYSYNETVFGSYNTVYTPSSATAWVASDRLFVVGNGTAYNSTGNALTLYKNGNMTISGTLTQSSDIRLKTNIRPFTDVLSQIQLVQPIYYEFKDKKLHPEGTQIGFSAQEIQQYWPELVRKDENGYLSVDYAGMTVVLLQAVKEQQQTIQLLQKEVEQLKNK